MKLRVLVVEDNADLAENIQELFEDTGAEVEVVSTVVGAMAAARKRVHLAIVDLRLAGGESGLDLLPELQAAFPDGEVILVTGNATLGSAIEAVRQGVFAYVQKPFDPEELLTLGERALGQVRLRLERARLAGELARSEGLHRAVVEGVDSLIVGIDGDGRIQMWNRAAAATLGWSAEEALGQDAEQLLVGPNRQPILGAGVLAPARDGEARQFEVDVLTRDGRRRTVRWRVTPLVAEVDGPALVLVVGNDETERLALEARAAEAEAMAAMGRLTTGLAHEIRNPLNAASLQLELMSRGIRRLEDRGAAESLDCRALIVKEELGRLSGLLNEFLGLARPTRHEEAEVDVAALLTGVAEAQRPEVEAAGLTLHAEVLGAVGTVVGNDSRLKQALVNLVLNAVDAMRDQGQGTVRMVAEVVAGWLELRVEDEGTGLDGRDSEDLFRPFVTTKAAGTGLGLPIVKKIIEAHGGRIEIGPRPGRGTVAKLRLPLEGAAAAPRSAHASDW